MENARNEFLRLRKYMLVPSNSPIASPLAIALKPTKPYVRFCGDYVYINKFIVHAQHFIPNVQQELTKASKAQYYCDLDMRNAFHQIQLSLLTSLRLSIITMWGTFRPVFMPESISPATGVLNTIMTEIFKDLLESVIVIFDNFLVLSTSHEDTYNKLVQLITVCADRNVILGLAKSKIGYDEAVFFGYKVSKGTYRMTEERKIAISTLAMPTTT